jgi:uncharacterized protein (TIGR02147 family)
VDSRSVYRYSDFRQFLSDWQAARQATDPGFHKSSISKRLGLPHTRSYFTDVLGGKKVTPVFLERFLELLDLPKNEARYFRALVQYNQATSTAEREEALDLLIALNQTPRTIVQRLHYQYYRNWWTGALRAVLAIENHGDDWAALAKRVMPEITPGQAKASMELMRELGLIQQVDGFWKPTDQALSTGDDIRDQLVLQLQVQQFELARMAITTRHEHPKDVSTNTMSISSKGFEQLKRRIADFRSEVCSIIKNDDAPDRVYNFCLALFPISRTPTP